MYTFGTSFTTMSFCFNKIPRYVCIILRNIGQHRQSIGHWSTMFGVIVILEHVLFHKTRWSNYNVGDWNQPGKLPLGLAAVASVLCSCDITIPFHGSSAQAWYPGLIAKAGMGEHRDSDRCGCGVVDLPIVSGGREEIDVQVRFRVGFEAKNGEG